MKEQYKNLTIFFSNKLDGNMAMKYGENADLNRQAFFQKMGIEIGQCLFMQPNNGDHVVELKDSVIEYDDLYYKLIEADAIICKVPNIYLYLNFGDCIPFVLYDQKQNIFAFAHLGWRSTYLNLHQKLFSIFVDHYHSNIEDLMIILGPCIKKESYLLPNPEQKEEELWKEYVSYVKDDLYSIDLRGYVIDFFKAQKLPNSNIVVSDIDTGSDLNYFSHYRATMMPNEIEGRFLFGVGMEHFE